MKNGCQHCDNEAGIAMVVVLCTTLVLAGLLTVLAMVTGSHARITRYQEYSEKAFFIAEGGLERMAQEIANGRTVPASFSGMLGEGSYVGTVISGASITDAWHSVGGQININPNNNPNNEFSVTLADGTVIGRELLVEDYPGFIGEVRMVHLKPKGGGHQNSLLYDGSPYDFDNNSTYDIISDCMSVSIYNDNVNTNGKAVGQWFVAIAAAETDFVVNGVGNGSGNIGQARVQYSMLSVGTVKGRSKVIMRETVKQKTWAQYAMWMNNNNGIYFKQDEKLYGPVYSTEKLSFSGNPEFFSDCKSVATTYGGSTNQCIFHNGFQRGVSNETMAKVSFSNLQNKATLQLSGTTSIAFSQTNILITNSRQGWTNQVVGTSSNSVIYVKTTTAGDASTRPGDIYVGGTLNGRITLVAERDFYITNHLYYSDNPKTNLLSTDALGMIAKRDINVTTNAPDNLNIYAHMMATGLYDTNITTDGSFGAINYDTRPPSGFLTIHGGVVQDDRGAVGTFSGTNLVSGFNKNYTYDTRFATDPPPEYPPLSSDLIFGTWRER